MAQVSSTLPPEPIAADTLPPELIAADQKHRRKAGLAPDDPKRRNRDREHTHAARAPPPLVERLLNKYEVMTMTSLSYPTLWAWMRAGKFPRSRIVGGKSMWVCSEVNAWISGLPVFSRARHATCAAWCGRD
jgi:predicted DNA-binding transcriptional regulator AlpA